MFIACQRFDQKVFIRRQIGEFEPQAQPTKKKKVKVSLKSLHLIFDSPVLGSICSSLHPDVGSSGETVSTQGEKKGHPHVRRLHSKLYVFFTIPLTMCHYLEIKDSIYILARGH